MAQSTNIVVITGNMTRDPELRHIPSGTAVCDIGVAVNDRVKQGNDWKDVVSFIEVTLWGRTAEVCCEYCGKGSAVLIEGKLKQESWEKDGTKHSKVKVVAERLQMLGGKKEGGGGGSRQPQQTQRPSYEPPAEGDDSVPF
jgi:single-strand DNA-binding protein